MAIFQPIKNNITLRLISGFIPAGFPSPAQDYMEEDIDLQQLLIEHPLATFLVRVKGNSMVNAHIPDGALLVVDKSKKPMHNDIVVGIINGEFTVKRLIKRKNEVMLQPENPAYKPLLITEAMDFSVWGVVVHIIIDATTI